MEKEHLEGDIIFFALSRWNGPYSSTAISLAKEFSKTNRVIYIDSPFTYKDLISGLLRKEIYSKIPTFFLGIKRFRKPKNHQNVIQVISPLTIPINFLSKGNLYNYLSKINEGILNHFLRNIIRKLNLSKYVFINCYNPFYFSDPNRINSDLNIYYCFDNISQSSYIQKHGVTKEIESINAYDLTLTTSEELFRYASQHSKNCYCLPNAADFSLFHQSEDARPMEYPNTAIIGYIGNIDHRLDKELIRYIARKYPEKTLVLIGPITDSSIYEFLKEEPNIQFLGKKLLEELPKYVKHFDCGIIPFKINALTKYIYPLKLNEYLACGIPVITTGFSKDVMKFNHVVEIENEYSSFCELIVNTIGEDNEQRALARIEVSKQNSWSNRAIELKRLIKRQAVLRK